MTLSSPNEGPVNLRKPVEALVMVPRTHKLSPLGRKMYNVLLYVSQMTLRAMNGVPPATHLFSVPLVDVLRICGADSQNTMAKKYLAEMRRTEVVWDSPDSNAELQQVGFALLSESRITKRNGVTHVHWALPPTLYESLADPHRWATIDLLVLSRLTSYAAIVLYEICSKYRNNPTHLTCRRSVSWWVELLSSTSHPIDPKTGERKLREWRKFKNAIVNDAIKEINEVSDLYITLIEGKDGGKAVKTVQFTVDVKRSDSKTNPGLDSIGSQGNLSADVTDFAHRLGVQGIEDVVHMAANHGEEEVIRALHALEARQQQLELPLVKSPSGYLKFLLNDAPVVAREVEETPPIPAEVTLLRERVPEASSVLTDDKEQRDRWVQGQRDAMLAELLGMPAEELAIWLKAYADAMKAKGMLTVSMQRRLANPDWCVGAVKIGVVDFYGQAKQGSSWLQYPELTES